jgi:hypothetical protein
MIKEIKTETFEGLAVLVPDDARNFDIGRWAGRRLIFNQGKYEVDNMKTGSIELSLDSEYEILGKATELTEEQCEDISPYECPNQWCEGGYIDQGYNEKWICDYCQEEEDKESPNIERFASLLQSLGCYAVNPYGDKPSILNNDVWYSEEQWQEAQANTGTWLIIGKI